MSDDRDDDVFAQLAQPELDHDQDHLWDTAMAVDRSWHGDGLSFPSQSPLTATLARLDAPLGHLGDVLTRALDRAGASIAGRRPLTLRGVGGGLAPRTRVLAAATAGLLTAVAVGGLLSADGSGSRGGDDAPVAAGAPATDTDGRLLDDRMGLIPAAEITPAPIGSSAGADGPGTTSTGGSPPVARGASGDAASSSDGPRATPGPGTVRDDTTGGGGGTVATTPGGASVGDGAAAGGAATSGGAPAGGSPSGPPTPSGGSGPPSSEGGNQPGSGPSDGGGSSPAPPAPPPTDPPPPPTSPPPTTPPPTVPPTTPPPPPPPANPVCQLLPILCPGGGLIP